MDLEGIVAKRKWDPYATAATWYAIGNPAYTRPEERLDPFRSRGRQRRAAHPMESAPA